MPEGRFLLVQTQMIVDVTHNEGAFEGMEIRDDHIDVLDIVLFDQLGYAAACHIGIVVAGICL